jgi:hypothetical protein
MRVSGAIPGGWRVLSIWESQEAFDTFRRERLAPALQQAGRPMPIFTLWPVEDVRSPGR